jgi:prepilin-type N-terminal cleavage/methylation domain-containing protein
MLLKNEKGLTIMELLVSLFILSLILAATLAFYGTYLKNTNELGNKNTARNLAIDSMERQLLLTDEGDTSTGQVNRNSVVVNNTEFRVTVMKEDLTDGAISDIFYYNQKVPFYKLRSIVNWDLQRIEVEAYSSRKR